MKQIPPVVKGGSRTDIVAASFVSSDLYEQSKKLSLTVQYRAAEDPEWSVAVSQFGHGTIESVARHPQNDEEAGLKMVRMPLVKSLFHEDDEDFERAALEHLYGLDDRGQLRLDDPTAAILATTNEEVHPNASQEERLQDSEERKQSVHVLERHQEDLLGHATQDHLEARAVHVPEG